MNLDSFGIEAIDGEHGPAMLWAYEELLKYAHLVKSNHIIDVRSVHMPRPSSDEWSKLGVFLREPFHPRCKVSFNPWVNCHSVEPKLNQLLSSTMDETGGTCSPFLVGNSPSRGSICAWGGRGAVCFLNSIIGAYTNTESFSTSLASAITGKTVMHGLLLESNRAPEVSVRIEGEDEVDSSLLGFQLSKVVNGRPTKFIGLRRGLDEMRRFASSFNHDGRQPIFQLGRERDDDTITIDLDEIDCYEPPFVPDEAVLLFGCPHLSEQQINTIAKIIADRNITRHRAFFYTSRLCIDKSPKTGSVLSDAGSIRISTCPMADREEWDGKEVFSDNAMLVESLHNDGCRATFLPSSLLMNKLIS